MKKTYESPACSIVRLTGASEMLTGSILSTDGGDNTLITPGNEEYDGTFKSRETYWDGSDWSDAE